MSNSNQNGSKPPSKLSSNASSLDSKTPTKLQSNTATSTQTVIKMDCGNDANYAELQKSIQEEVVRAVELWRKGMVQGTLESQNERIESFIKQLEDENFGARAKTSCSILAELKRENDQLRDELEGLRKFNVKDITVERLQELQHDNKNLRNIIIKLQEEVQEKNTAHNRKIREQQDIIRKSHANTLSGESVVNRLKSENQELKTRVAELIKTSEEEETDETKQLNCQLCPPLDLNEKLSKAQHRLKIACVELKLKQKHPRRIPAHSMKSLEDIACVWTEHANLLKILLRKQTELNALKDRLDMFVSNIEILKDENSDLNGRLSKVREEMKTFRENPMKPTEQVVKNVNLLLHMEKIDNSLAEKAVQLDNNEKDLKREQLRVREILIRVEELRRENRHLSRRLQKDAVIRDYQSRIALAGLHDDDSTSSCSNSDHTPLLGMYGNVIENSGVGMDLGLEEIVKPGLPDDVDHQYQPESEGTYNQAGSDGTDVQVGSDSTEPPHSTSEQQEESLSLPHVESDAESKPGPPNNQKCVQK